MGDGSSRAGQTDEPLSIATLYFLAEEDDRDEQEELQARQPEEALVDEPESSS